MNTLVSEIIICDCFRDLRELYLIRNVDIRRMKIRKVKDELKYVVDSTKLQNVCDIIDSVKTVVASISKDDKLFASIVDINLAYLCLIYKIETDTSLADIFFAVEALVSEVTNNVYSSVSYYSHLVSLFDELVIEYNVEPIPIINNLLNELDNALTFLLTEREY